MTESLVRTLSHDVMTNFVESGWSQWFCNLEYKRKDVEADELEIIELSFEEYDEGTGEPLTDDDGNRKVYVITHKQIRDAMKKIAAGESNLNSELTDRIKEAVRDRNYANLDAETDDCIVQVAAFGEVVYG